MRNTFDVFKEMCDNDLDIRSAPLSNITSIQENSKGALVTIGVDKPTARKLITADKEYPFVGGLILADKETFHELAKKTFPKIICLCGSTRFYEKFAQINLEFTLYGKIVLSIGCDTKSDDNLFSKMDECTKQSTKRALDDLHLRKIDLADEVFIINVDGYIGESTAKEIEYAKKHNKLINYLEKP